MKIANVLLSLALGLVALAAAAENTALLPGDPARGKTLVQNQCTACHVKMTGGDGSKIYTRPDRRVKSVEGLIGQVRMCNSQLDTNLSKGEMDDIVIFLNENYYRFQQ